MFKLPDSELSVMLVIWNANQPLTAAEILERLEEKSWHIATLNKLITRLIDKGFIETVCKVRPKKYSDVIDKEAYKRFESKSFFKKLHRNSFSSLIASLYDEQLSQEDINELEKLILSQNGDEK